MFIVSKNASSSPTERDSAVVASLPTIRNFFEDLSLPSLREEKQEAPSKRPFIEEPLPQFAIDHNGRGIVIKSPRKLTLEQIENPARVDIYVPGVGSTQKEMHTSTRAIAHTVGRTAIGIENERKFLPYVIGIANGLFGLISPKLGSIVENRAVKTLKDFLRSELPTLMDESPKTKDPRDLHLHLHSQGGIIGQNALWLLRDELGAESSEWKALASALSIHLYGSPVKNWPPELDITSLVFEDDFPAKVIDLTSRITSFFSPRKGRDPKQISQTGSYHTLINYMRRIRGFTPPEPHRESESISLPV